MGRQDETQPFRNPDNRNNREYVPAVFDADHAPEDSPKVSGGFEKQKGYDKPAPRGLNRLSQRYTLPAVTLQARRAITATAEYSETLVLRTEFGRYEIRSVSGSSYDCVLDSADGWIDQDNNLVICQCMDEWRLRMSGYDFATVCKHVLIARIYVTATGVDNVNLTTEAVAEATGFDQRTVEHYCKTGEIIATKLRETWSITPADYFDAVAFLTAKIVHPDWDLPELP